MEIPGTGTVSGLGHITPGSILVFKVERLPEAEIKTKAGLVLASNPDPRVQAIEKNKGLKAGIVLACGEYLNFQGWQEKTGFVPFPAGTFIEYKEAMPWVPFVVDEMKAPWSKEKLKPNSKNSEVVKHVDVTRWWLPSEWQPEGVKP